MTKGGLTDAAGWCQHVADLFSVGPQRLDRPVPALFVMNLLSPDLVAKAQELPSSVLLATAAVGPLFWALGWRIHRVLFVAGTTVVGGIYGLVHGPSIGLHPLVAAGLLSLSAAALSLAFLRIGLFVLSGLMASVAVGRLAAYWPQWQAAQWLAPGAFFVGGLASLVWYRFLVITLTSFVGSYLIVLGGLGYAARQGKSEGPVLAEGQEGWVVAALLALTALGVVAQYMAERRRVVVKTVVAKPAAVQEANELDNAKKPEARRSPG